MSVKVEHGVQPTIEQKSRRSSFSRKILKPTQLLVQVCGLFLDDKLKISVTI